MRQSKFKAAGGEIGDTVAPQGKTCSRCGAVSPVVMFKCGRHKTLHCGKCWPKHKSAMRVRARD